MNANLQRSALSISIDIVGTLYLDNVCYPIAIIKNFANNQEQSENSIEVCRFEINQTMYVALKNEQPIENQGSDPVKLLTERELQIALLIASGKQNKHIAKQLNISEWTVSTHLRRIFTKLGVGSRAAMVYRCSSLINSYKNAFD
jgi:DNA-binding NarL/FixJ family response regulator